MRIYLCDDNALFTSELESLLLAYFEDNALESAASSSSPYVEISAQRREGTPYALVTLENGCDEAPEEALGGLLRSRKKGPGHHGLGLASVRRIAKAHGGHVTHWHDGERRVFHTVVLLRRSPSPASRPSRQDLSGSP